MRSRGRKRSCWRRGFNEAAGADPADAPGGAYQYVMNSQTLQ